MQISHKPAETVAVVGSRPPVSYKVKNTGPKKVRIKQRLSDGNSEEHPYKLPFDVRLMATVHISVRVNTYSYASNSSAAYSGYYDLVDCRHELTAGLPPMATGLKIDFLMYYNYPNYGLAGR